MSTPKDKSQEGPYRVERFDSVHSSVKLYEVVGPGIFNGRSEPMDYHAACVWSDRLNAAYAAGQAAMSTQTDRIKGALEAALNAFEFLSRSDPDALGWAGHDTPGGPWPIAKELQSEMTIALSELEAQQPAAGLTVEEIMGVVEEWYASSPLMPMPHSTQYEYLRARLTKLMQP